MMSEDISFFEHEALESAIVAAAKSLQLKQPPTWLIQSSDRPDQIVGLNDRLLEVLRNPSLSKFVHESETLPPPEPGSTLGLRLFRASRKNRAGKMAFFRVTNALDTGYWSLIGLLTAICLRSSTFVLPSGAILTNIFRNFIQLKPERDAHAIAAYNAFIVRRLELTSDAAGEASANLPTTEDIHARTGYVDLQMTINGLTRLRELNLLKVQNWGGKTDDITDARNEWKELL